MVTSGIRHLVVSAISDARFIDVEMLWDDEDQWSAAATCDAAVICGNPRFSVSPDDAWWECGIWSRINELSRSGVRSEEHTSELQSLMRRSYAVFCLKKKQN